MPVYYVFGKDDLLIGEKVRELLAHPDVRKHFASDLPLDELITLMTVVDLFAIEEAHWIDGCGELKLLGSASDRLEAAIETCPPNKRIAFTQNTNFRDWRKEKDYEKKSIHKLLDAKAREVHDLKSQSYPKNVTKWTAARARDVYGLKLTDLGIEMLAEASGYQPQFIDGELKKLSVFKVSDKTQRVPDDLLARQLVKVPSEKLFEYVDALLERRPEAVNILRETMSLGTEGTVILSNIHRNFDMMVRCDKEGARNVEEISRMHTFVRDKFYEHKRGWSAESTVRVLELVGETDFRLKTLGMDEYDVLALLTVEVMKL